MIGFEEKWNEFIALRKKLKHEEDENLDGLLTLGFVCKCMFTTQGWIALKKDGHDIYNERYHNKECLSCNF